MIAQLPQISSHLSPTPLPYESVLTSVQQSEVVLMPYEIPDSIRFKVPSKLYESIALRKAILISKNPLWENILAPYPAGLAIDFTKTREATRVYRKLLSLRLYQNLPGKEVTWEGEKEKLGALIARLLS